MSSHERKNNSEYWQKRLEAKAFYSSIGKVWCPAVGDWVVFNAHGFNHLIRKGGLLRSYKDQIRRFVLLKQAVSIIEGSKEYDNYKKEETAEFWTIRKNTEDKIIKVVIRQLVGGKKHFFSIMDNK